MHDGYKIGGCRPVAEHFPARGRRSFLIGSKNVAQFRLQIARGRRLRSCVDGGSTKLHNFFRK